MPPATAKEQRKGTKLLLEGEPKSSFKWKVTLFENLRLNQTLKP